jgi:hypothetical protein
MIWPILDHFAQSIRATPILYACKKGAATPDRRAAAHEQGSILTALVFFFFWFKSLDLL